MADTVLNSQSSIPSPVYNQAGTTVDAYVGGLSSVPTTINRESQRTVVEFASGAGSYVTLPSGADPGDEVLFFYDSGVSNSPVAYPPSGEQFQGGYTSAKTGRYFMKISSSTWGVFQ
ncbi:MAG TPA: hypothetical protein VJ777_21730 [Mycobacterium sp.]|nr:hypothetical protein [Mycobacterium sp.]